MGRSEAVRSILLSFVNVDVAAGAVSIALHVTRTHDAGGVLPKIVLAEGRSLVEETRVGTLVGIGYISTSGVAGRNAAVHRVGDVARAVQVEFVEERSHSVGT